jgi:hypothetical protein
MINSYHGVFSKTTHENKGVPFSWPAGTVKADRHFPAHRQPIGKERREGGGGKKLKLGEAPQVIKRGTFPLLLSFYYT